MLTQMPESVEADAEDSDTEKKKEPLAKVFSPWASLDSIKDMLHSERETTGKRHTNKAAMDAARDLTHLLWGCDEAVDAEVASLPNKDGSIGTYTKSRVTKPLTGGSVTLEQAEDFGGNACLRYRGLTPENAARWLQNLRTNGLETDTRKPRPRPNEEQNKILQRMVDRCLQERVDESKDNDFRSEPLQVLLHGVPGAGKSEVLYWIRDFFETCASGCTERISFSWRRRIVWRP